MKKPGHSWRLVRLVLKVSGERLGGAGRPVLYPRPSASLDLHMVPSDLVHGLVVGAHDRHGGHLRVGRGRRVPDGMPGGESGEGEFDGPHLHLLHDYVKMPVQTALGPRVVQGDLPSSPAKLSPHRGLPGVYIRFNGQFPEWDIRECGWSRWRCRRAGRSGGRR